MTESQTSGLDQRLSALYKVASRLSSTYDLNDLLALVMDAAIRLTAAERGFLALVDDESAELGTAIVHNVDQGGIGGEAMIIVRQVVDEETPFLTNDVQKDERFAARQGGIGDKLQAIICVPLRVRDGAIGALYVDRASSNDTFVQEDLDLLATFAAQAAVAIENARLHDALQTVSEDKSEYVSLVTHELRIPLTSVRGYTDLLLKEMAGPLNDSQRQFLGTIRRNLDRMGVLIRDLSDINRIEGGRMQFQCEPYNLHDILQHVVGDLQEAFVTRQQTFVLDVPRPAPLVFADRSRVGQIVTNLLHNANVYTPEGGEITLRARSERGMACVDVIDNGIGVPEEEQSQLFTEFFRGEANAVREHSGWGLGLAIVKKLVTAQGGEVSFSTEPGKGSIFSFTLPLAEGSER